MKNSNKLVENRSFLWFLMEKTQLNAQTLNLRKFSCRQLPAHMHKKKPAKKKDSLKGKPVTHLANMLDAHIFGPNRFKR